MRYLRYPAIVLNTLQGLFICAAFVLGSRVRRKWIRKISSAGRSAWSYGSGKVKYGSKSNGSSGDSLESSSEQPKNTGKIASCKESGGNYTGSGEIGSCIECTGNNELVNSNGNIISDSITNSLGEKEVSVINEDICIEIGVVIDKECNTTSTSTRIKLGDISSDADDIKTCLDKSITVACAPLDIVNEVDLNTDDLKTQQVASTNIKAKLLSELNEISLESPIPNSSQDNLPSISDNITETLGMLNYPLDTSPDLMKSIMDITPKIQPNEIINESIDDVTSVQDKLPEIITEIMGEFAEVTDENFHIIAEVVNTILETQSEK